MHSSHSKSSVYNRRDFMKIAGATSAAVAACSAIPCLAFTHEEALAAAQQTGETVTPTFCGMCGPRDVVCGVYAFSKDGVFTRVAGMKEFPVNQGALCPKGQSAPQLVYNKDRIKKPLIRVGKKGEGKFREASWDEAIQVIANKLKEQKEKYGAKSLAALSPAFRDYSEWTYRFLTAHGSPNYGHSGICAMQLSFSLNYTLGTRPSPDYSQADLILVWGKQPIYSGPAQGIARNFISAKTRDAKIITIKPSMEPDGALGDEWMPVRPGTDAALALAMLNVVIGEDLIDHDFVEKWCYGFDEFKTHVKQYTPEWAEKICGVPADQIKSVARLYATTPKAAIDYGNGLEHAPSASDTIRSLGILLAITGHLDRPGGNVYPTGNKRPKSKPVPMPERYTQEWVDNLVGYEFPKEFQPFIEGTSCAYTRIFESVLSEKPYPIRAVIAPGSQPIVSTRGGNAIIEALEKLDFYVALDITRFAEMPWADVVMPILTVYETDYPFLNAGNWVMARNKVIEPTVEGKTTQEFYMDLAVAMGYGDDFWQGDIHAAMDDQLSPYDMTYQELKKHPTGLRFETDPPAYERYEKFLNTKSTRIDKGPYLNEGKVAIYNTLFEKAGYAAMPAWHEPPEGFTATPELTEKYPLAFSDYHTSISFSAGWQQNVPFLREILPYPTLHIHPDTAKDRDIKDGDWIVVESPHGNMKIKAELYPGIRPDTVMMLHGWWMGCKEFDMPDYPLTDGGANANSMYSFDPEKIYDPLVTAMSSQTLVQVRKA